MAETGLERTATNLSRLALDWSADEIVLLAITINALTILSETKPRVRTPLGLLCQEAIRGN